MTLGGPSVMVALPAGALPYGRPEPNMYVGLNMSLRSLLSTAIGESQNNIKGEPTFNFLLTVAHPSAQHDMLKDSLRHKGRGGVGQGQVSVCCV